MRTAKKNGLHVFEDTTGEYRWRIMRAGRIVADSAESYTREADAIRAAHSLRRFFESRTVPVWNDPKDRKR